MSIILDALRKVEQEKKLQKQPQIDIKQRLLHDRKPVRQVSPLANRFVLLGGLVAVSGGILYGSYALLNSSPRNAVAAQNSIAAAVPAPITKDVSPDVTPMPVEEPVVDLTTAKTSRVAMNGYREPTGRGMEKERRPGRQPAMDRKQVAHRVPPRHDTEEEDFSEAVAAPVHREQPYVTAGIEPPAPRPALAAPAAPSVVLDGIIYHTDPDKRSALLRLRGESSSTLVKIGDSFGRLKVEEIDQSRVALSGASKPVELKLE